jgi:hypothetical protein
LLQSSTGGNNKAPGKRRKKTTLPLKITSFPVKPKRREKLEKLFFFLLTSCVNQIVYVIAADDK